MPVMRMPVTGGTPQFLLSARPLSEFRCARSPSSLCVLGERSEDRRQFVFTAIDPLTGRGAELVRVDIHSEAKKLHWDLSPDGTRLAFTRTPDDPIEIFSLGANTSQTIQVRDWKNLDSLDWTADGQAFYIASGVHGGMILLRVDLLGNSTVLQRNVGDASAFARPSPDGRHLAIFDYRVDGNIWSLENF
jgi:Tol biopolymer transport system component